MLPSLFVSHGSPMMALTPGAARDFLAGLGTTLPRPTAILIASAHWETERPAVNAVAANDTIHDFYGFPAPLYALRYPAPGSAVLAARVAGLLNDAGLACDIDPTRGLDHGAWIPLALMYPAHDIPVVELSVQPWLGPQHHFLLGEALAPLRAEGVLIIGSGAFTHDLRRLRREEAESPEGTPDVAAFSEWMRAVLAAGDIDSVLDYRRRAPTGAAQHPTEEHLLPLFVALGAGGTDAPAQRLHASANHGVLRMDAFAFGVMN
ncbi:MAG TPA: class III extradiol ring-cleavage dioxygenase [Acetobacteraceae bacterium]|nr:class III extradiol ring-cleavage dioxygenase [Acetobacteraceae bacterium]